MNCYVCADNNFGISIKGKPLASIPAETQTRIREVTGKVAVYGLDYINDLPGQQPLRDTVNIIFTDGRKTSVKPSKSVILCDTLEEVRSTLKDYKSEDICVLHHEKLYKEFLKDFDVIHVTKIDYTYKADAFFDNLDKNPDFYITADSEEQYCFDIVYYFYRYERRKNK